MAKCISPKRRKKNSEECKNLQKIRKAERVEEIGENRKELYFSLLPNEILSYIYEFLSPVDLASLSELGVQRLADLTYTVKEANFSSCRRDNPQLVASFFSRNRVKCIQKLNFDNCFSLKPSEITNFICRCKNLTSLSVVECGLTYKNVRNILESCSKLEEFAWNVGEVCELDQFVSCPNVKKVYLFCNSQDLSLDYVCYTLQNFSKVENVWINLASDSLSALPFIGLWLRSTCMLSAEFRRQCTLITNTFNCINNSNDCELVSKIASCDLLRKDRGFEAEVAEQSKVYNYAPCLQIRSMKEDLALLTAVPFHSYTSMAIILTSELVYIYEELIKFVQDVAGDKLRHFSLQNEAYYYNFPEYYEQSSHSMPMTVYNVSNLSPDMLERIFLTCKHITVLNLTTIHFHSKSPIKAITHLKYLKILELPSCAFSKLLQLNEEDHDVEFPLLVSSCREVETFSFNCCITDKRPIAEHEVVPIRGWKHLKHLSIYNIIFHSCTFLRQVADSCMQLQSLSLIAVAPKKVSIYTNNVIYLLKKAKNLSFLRINEKKFNPMYERFWSTIGEATNLEGICIITESTGAIDRQTIINGIKNLKYLHLFHFQAPKATEQLYFQVKKSMKEHDIKNIRIEKFCCNETYNLLRRGQYYHREPPFCCQEAHLQGISVF